MKVTAFLAKPKRQDLVSNWGEYVYSAKSQKERWLSYESKFVPFDGSTLILRKIIEIKAFLAKPKHRNHASQWKKCVYFAQSKKE